MNVNDIPTSTGNSNDQSQPKRVYADPIDIQRLCLHTDNYDSRAVPTYVGDRVNNPRYGDGLVINFGGAWTVGTAMTGNVNCGILVKFDSGITQRLPSFELTHI